MSHLMLYRNAMDATNKVHTANQSQETDLSGFILQGLQRKQDYDKKMQKKKERRRRRMGRKQEIIISNA